MESSYHFTFEKLEATALGSLVAVLTTADSRQRLRIQMPAGDAQTIAAEVAGLNTPRKRLGSLLGRVVEHLGATLSEVMLYRNRGNLVEAQLVLDTGQSQVMIPIACSDAVALAVTHGVSISGDQSLASLLHILPQAEEEEVVAVPAIFEAYLNSLAAW